MPKAKVELLLACEAQNFRAHSNFCPTKPKTGFFAETGLMTRNFFWNSKTNKATSRKKSFELDVGNSVIENIDLVLKMLHFFKNIMSKFQISYPYLI